MPNALRLYAITDVEHHAQSKPLDGTELLHFRDLAAVVSPADYSTAPPSGEVIEQYWRIVDDVFGKAPVLQAPVGTVFRSRETLTRWLELHYVALSEALAFIEDRAVARVHVAREEGRAAERDTGSDVAAVCSGAREACRARLPSITRLSVRVFMSRNASNTSCRTFVMAVRLVCVPPVGLSTMQSSA